MLRVPLVMDDFAKRAMQLFAGVLLRDDRHLFELEQLHRVTGIADGFLIHRTLNALIGRLAAQFYSLSKLRVRAVPSPYGRIVYPKEVSQLEHRCPEPAELLGLDRVFRPIGAWSPALTLPHLGSTWSTRASLEPTSHALSR